MKLVHFSDLHLDSAFAWMWAADPRAARRRRQGLRETLQRIVGVAQEVQADALLCGGDLFEHERCSPDTAAFLRETFAEAGRPVYLAPGNHDWLGPASPYRQVAWTANVHLFDEPRLRPVQLADDITLWGAAHCAPAGTPGFLESFRVDRGGIHLALFHGAEMGWLGEQGAEKAPHAPFMEAQVARAGLHHAFVGHFHRPRDAALYTYPGNPDPLSFGEDGVRGAVVATVLADGSVRRERRIVATTRATDLVVDVSGAASMQAIWERVRAAVMGLDGVVRATLSGTLEPSVDLRLDQPPDPGSTLDALWVRAGNLASAYDLATLSREQTVRGQFVRDVLAADVVEADRRRILATGLRALDGCLDLDAA